MSRPSQLPPRIPLRRKAVAPPTHEPNSLCPPGINESGTRHLRSFSQSSTLEDQPAWLDDLLSDSDSIPRRIFHCRSASDSVTLFHDIVPSTLHSESRDEEHSGSEEGVNALESACMYGPNSPRRKSNVEFSESSLLMALSNYVSQNSVQFVEEIPQKSRTTYFDQMGDCCSSPNEQNSEAKSGKRHPGQRSRARKLQYIAELERTVNVFQALESELAIRISTLLQQRVVLSVENSKLKQQMARLQQQKLIMDDEYQTLRKEAERLKFGLASSLSNNNRTYAGSSETNATEISWQMLDWKKLKF